VSHPSLGLPPPTQVAGFPDAAARLRQERSRLAARALEVAVHDDPTLRSRYDEPALRNLLLDAEVLIDRLAMSVAGNDPYWLREFADHTATVYRRRRVAMDDVVRLCEGLRAAARTVLTEAEMVPADRAIDEAITVYRWYRRLAGDARKRNPILALLYKGA
jgi:hypothetical protein